MFKLGARFLCLLASVSLVACNTTTPIQPQQNPALNGKTIFQAVFFGGSEGEKLMPDVWANTTIRDARNKVDAEAYARRISAVTEHLERKDSNYFDDFQAQMTSGNPLKVQKALTKTSQDMLGAIKTIDPEVYAAMMSADNNDNRLRSQALVIGVAAYMFVVVVHTAAIAVNVGFVFALATKVASPLSVGTEFSKGLNLSQEQLIAGLTTRLARAQ